MLFGLSARVFTFLSLRHSLHAFRLYWIHISTFSFSCVSTAQTIKDKNNMSFIFTDFTVPLSLSSPSTVVLPRRCLSAAWIPAVLSAFMPRTRRILRLCVLLLAW